MPGFLLIIVMITILIYHTWVKLSTTFFELFCFCTVPANAIESSGVCSNRSVKIPGGLFFYTVYISKLYVLNTMTMSADKVAVGFCITVKTVRAVACGNLCNFTEFYQKWKIPVYGTKADIWKFGFDSCIHSVCGRVLLTALYKCSDTFPLPAVF